MAFSLVGRQDAARDDREPDPPDPGHRGGRLRDPPVRGARHRANPVVRAIMYPRDPRPEDHDAAADRRHDRGRDRLDGAGARGRRRGDPGRERRRSSASRWPCRGRGSGAGGAGAGGRGNRGEPGRRRDVAAGQAVPVEHRASRRPGACLDATLREVAAPVRRRPERARPPGDHHRPDAIRRLGQELARLEPVVAAFRRSRRPGPSWPALARCATARPTRSSGRWPARRSTG